MKEINGLFSVPLGMNGLLGIGDAHWIFGAAAAGLGAVGTLFGGAASAKAAKKALKENKYRTNAEKAWYDKEYNTDYMDTKAGQNMLRRAQEIQDSYIRKADGAAAVGGGTAASTAMAKEAANRTMGNTVANIGAQDTARKQSVSDQHMRNEMSLSQQRENIYNQQAQNVSEVAQGFGNSMMGAASVLEGTSKKTQPVVKRVSPSAVGSSDGLVPKVNPVDFYTRAAVMPDKLKNVTGV